MNLIGNGGEFVEQRRQHRLLGGGCVVCSTLNTFSPTFGAIVCMADTKYIRKRVRSLSPSSSDNQAIPLAQGRGVRGEGGDPFADQRGFAKTGRGRDEGYLGLRCRPSFSRSIRRER